MDSLQLIHLKNGLFSDYRIDQVKKTIRARLQELNMLDPKYKLDTQFWEFLANLVEHLVTKKDKIDKKELVFSLATDVFGATPEDLDIIGKIIEYLHANGRIKKISFYRLFLTGIREFFFAKR
jgi:hypothetical protein